MSSEDLKVLENAREELRKQLVREAETIVAHSRIATATETRAKIVEIHSSTLPQAPLGKRRLSRLILIDPR
jgi:hypothetical protein